MAVATAACGGDATSPGGNNNSNQGSITFTLSLAALSIVQGANGAVGVTVSRAGGYAGAVSIAIEGLPANVTASATPGSIGATATQSTITFVAAAGAAPGTTNVTIRASGSGVADQARTLALTITAAVQPGFGLTVSPGTLTIQQGGQANSTATLARTGGFAGNVQFSATGAPLGVTVSFNPAGTTANTSAITVAVSAAVAANTYAVAIRATAAGLPERTVILNVTVTAAPGSASRTFRFCPPSLAPIFAAYQDGNGPWTVVPVVNNAVTFPMTSARGGLVYVTSPGANTYLTNYYYGTQAELGASGAQPCPAVPATKSVSGSIANVGAGETASVGLGAAGTVVSPAAPNFTLENVPEGVTDLIATRVAEVIAFPDVTQTANRVIIRRGLNPPANSVLPVLDFNSAESFAPVMRNLTINNLSGDVVFVQATYITAGGGTALLYSELAGVPSANRQIPMLPNAQTGDLHGLSMIAGAAAPPSATSRGVLAYFTASADRTFTFGPVVGPVTVTSAATVPYARLRVQYMVQPEYDESVAVSYLQISGGGTRMITVNATGAYIGASPAFDHTEPDLSGLAGWNVIWGLAAGAVTQWALVGVGFNGTGGGVLDGAITLLATRNGSITP